MAEQDADNSALAEGRMTLIGHLTPHRRGALPTRPHARPHASQQRPTTQKPRASKRQHCRVSMPPYPLTIQPHRTNTT